MAFGYSHGTKLMVGLVPQDAFCLHLFILATSMVLPELTSVLDGICLEVLAFPCMER
jgi:hypothetical protein